MVQGLLPLSNPLENAVIYSGTASSVSGATITTSFTMTDNEFGTSDAQGNSSYYVQISDGTILDIISNTDSVLTVSTDVTSLINIDDEITIKKYTTLSDLFGTDNSAGLTAGADAGSSDTSLHYVFRWRWCIQLLLLPR